MERRKNIYNNFYVEKNVGKQKRIFGKKTQHSQLFFRRPVVAANKIEVVFEKEDFVLAYLQHLLRIDEGKGRYRHKVVLYNTEGESETLFEIDEEKPNEIDITWVKENRKNRIVFKIEKEGNFKTYPITIDELEEKIFHIFRKTHGVLG